MTSSSYFKSTLPYSTPNRKETTGKGMYRNVSWIRVKMMKFIKYCEAYGAIFGYYGAAIGGLLSCFIVVIFNEYEGGCKYPYLSEVARNGFGWWSFFIGTTIGCLPWILFAWDYYTTFKLLAMSIDNSCEKSFYLWKQKLCLLFNIISALGMNGTAFFDMGHYPMTHEVCVILFAVPCNLLFAINFVDMIKYGKEKDKGLIAFKLLILVGSFGGIILFTLLGRIEECKSVVITLEECLQLTSEKECYKYIDSYRDGWTVLRHYPRCHVMHFWRGFAEFIAVLCSAEYLCQLFYDRNKVQSLVFKEFGILPKNSHVLHELSEEDESFCNALTPSDVQDMND